MKNVLVIGGSYFAGRAFVEEILQHSEYVPYVMNRGNRPLNLPNVQELRADRHDPKAVQASVPPLDWHAVVDFVAYEPTDVETLLDALPGSINQYLLMSTTTVCQTSLDLPMTEDSPKPQSAPPIPGGDYGYKKWLTELKLREICDRRGIPHTSMRPAFIYGKYNYAPRESYFFKLIAQNKPIVVPLLPQALFTTVSVWDVARLILGCLGNKAAFGSAYNLSSGELICYDKLIEVLETITGKRFNVQRLSVMKIDADRLPLPFPLDEHLVYSGQRIANLLDFQYMSFQEGMTRTYNHFFGLEKGSP